MVFICLPCFFRSFALEETRKETDSSLFDKVEAEDLKLKCSTNLVGCHFQLTNHRQVVSLSTEILSNDEASKNVKLLYRRGVSHLVKWRLHVATLPCKMTLMRFD